MLINLRNALMAGKRLPYDAEVEYLESTGTQWIDTGIVVSNPSTIKIEFRASGLIYFGFGHNNMVSGTWLGMGTTDYVFSKNWNTRKTAGGYVRGDIKSCTWDGNSGFYLNGAKKLSFTASAGDDSISSNPWLFGAQFDFYSNSTKSSNSAWNLYALSIYTSNTLVRDFIPVRKGTVGYLYDRVSGKLFGNAGTGDFVLGPDVVPVEWLESDGNQYIDTGVKPDATYTFDTSVAVMQSNYNCTCWGCRSSGTYQSNNSQCYLASNTSGQVQDIFYYLRLISTSAGHNSNWNSGIIPETGRMYDFYGITTVPTMNAMTYPVVLFGLNIYGTINSTSGKVRIAKWTPYKSGVRVNDFRPVRVGTGSTWEGAMMDVLTRRIYRNQGTGAFTYGNDLKYPIPAE